MRALVIAAVLLAAACSTTEQAKQALTSTWVGRNADDFVAQYGLPSGQYQMQSGDTLLAWGHQANVHMPGTSTTTGYVNPSTGYYTATTTGGGGYDVEMACDLQLTVSPSGQIKNINIMRDTWGAWETSRCAEIFD